MLLRRLKRRRARPLRRWFANKVWGARGPKRAVAPPKGSTTRGADVKDGTRGSCLLLGKTGPPATRLTTPLTLRCTSRPCLWLFRSGAAHSVFTRRPRCRAGVAQSMFQDKYRSACSGGTSLVEFGPDLADSGPSSVDVGRSRATSGRLLANSGRSQGRPIIRSCRLKIHRFRPIPGQVGRCWESVPNLGEFGPNSTMCGRCSTNIGPESPKFRPALAKINQQFGPKSITLGMASDKFGPTSTLTKLDQNRPGTNSFNFGPRFLECKPMLSQNGHLLRSRSPNFGRSRIETWPTCGQSLSNCAEFRPSLPQFRTNASQSTKWARDRPTKLARIQPNLARNRPNLGGAGPNLTNVDKCLPKFGQI